MSEKKLYAVKTGEGEFLSFSDDGDSVWNKAIGHFETDKQKARSWAYNRGGHVVTLIEEPEKVVLTKKQAKIIEKAHTEESAIAFIFINGESDDDELLMRAYVNGYTVKKEKEYNVKVPHVPLYYWKKQDVGLGIDDLNVATSDDDTDDFEFTEAEIEHYGLQDCERVEIKQEGEK